MCDRYADCNAWKVNLDFHTFLQDWKQYGNHC